MTDGSTTSVPLPSASIDSVKNHDKHPASHVSPQLEKSKSFCRAITKDRAKNFYYGLMLTPEPKRSAMYAVYTWMRAVDDLADGNISTSELVGSKEESRGNTQRRLAAFAAHTHRVIVDPRDALGGFDDRDSLADMWPAVGRVFKEYDIPVQYLDDMVAGQLQDQTATRYRNFDSLSDYCYKVASTVGLVCIEVWGYEGDEATRQIAADRGRALQLTNILRDVVEDARRGRVYLPEQTLESFNFDADSLCAFVQNPDASQMRNFENLMQHHVDLARGFYKSTSVLESKITRACRPTSWALMKIYQRLLWKIAKNPLQVLTSRVKLSKWEKWGIAACAIWRRGIGS